jgi:hypothetical protein
VFRCVATSPLLLASFLFFSFFFLFLLLNEILEILSWGTAASPRSRFPCLFGNPKFYIYVYRQTPRLAANPSLAIDTPVADALKTKTQNRKSKSSSLAVFFPSCSLSLSSPPPPKKKKKKKMRVLVAVLALAACALAQDIGSRVADLSDAERLQDLTARLPNAAADATAAATAAERAKQRLADARCVSTLVYLFILFFVFFVCRGRYPDGGLRLFVFVLFCFVLFLFFFGVDPFAHCFQK